MKTLLMGLSALTVMAGAAQAASVRVSLTGVQPRGGHVLAALQTRAQFMKPASTAHVRLAGDASGQVRFVLADVAPGDYALSVLHDVDGDGRMTMDAQGRPAECWTMPHAASLRAVPTFDEVRVHVPAKGVALTLPMIYPAAR